MGEISRRVWDVSGRWVNSGAVTPAVVAVCEMAGIAIGAPPGTGGVVGAVAGALAGSVAEEVVSVNRDLWSSRVDGVVKFVDATERYAGAPIVQLLEEIAANREHLELFAHTAEAASRSLDGAKIDALAEIFVRGARESGNIDATSLLIDAVVQMARLHLRLLHQLSIVNPAKAQGDHQIWSEADIIAVDPAFGGVLDAVLSKLVGLGLVRNSTVGAALRASPTWTLTDFGRRCAAYLHEHAASATDTQPGS